MRRMVEVGARRAMRGWLGAALVGSLLLNTACSHLPMWDDFSSTSLGTAATGRLRRAAHLKSRGAGYKVPQEWKSRDRSYGTEEMVRAIERAAAHVAGTDRRVVLGVGDISQRQGGSMSHHGSHEAGRDVDLIFYSVNTRGKVLPPPEREMVSYDGNGEPFLPKYRQGIPFDDEVWQQRRFDTRRNWMLIEAFFQDPEVQVQWVFVSQPLKEHLISWAIRHHRPQWAIEYARVVMKQPGKAAPHDDHFHVRIYCSFSDRSYGCQDREPIWSHDKKAHKYGGPTRDHEWVRGVFVGLPLFLARG